MFTVPARQRSGAAPVALVLLALAVLWPIFAARADEQQIMAEAQARIAKHRTAEVTIAVVDGSGKPVPGARLEVQQTRHAFLFGCNAFLIGRAGHADDEKAYRAQFAALLNYATLPFYWGTYEPQPGRTQQERLEEMARWCREQGIAAKGHPLAWNMVVPGWLSDDTDDVHRRQLARIDDCVRHFRDLIGRWDVVNEVSDYDRGDLLRGASGKHTAMWQKVGQYELARQCFQRARQADPQATLLINDYVTSAKYERVIEQLVDAGGRRLYDAIGIQSHMHGGVWPSARILEVCDRFARFGVPLHFTEATILSSREPQPGRSWPSTPEGELWQAREVVRFYTLLFSHPSVEAITWWDFSDRHAWRGAPAGLVRADMTPKPAYRELLKLVKGQWWTASGVQTGADGTAPLRGFLGQYRVTASAQGKTVEVRDLNLPKPGTARTRWTVRLR